VATYTAIEDEARAEILRCGGSLSHHHGNVNLGVGKLRKAFLPETVGPVGLSMLKAVKEQLDPKNIFAVKNLIG
jgi:alkyldihydroxyacetonephosphate synthase